MLGRNSETDKKKIYFANKLWEILKTDFISVLPKQKTRDLVPTEEYIFGSIINSFDYLKKKYFL